MFHGFKVGDRVKILDVRGLGPRTCAGEYGTICVTKGVSGSVGVETDNVTGGHDCAHAGKSCAKVGHGWWYEPRQLEKIDVEKRSFRNGDIIKVHPKGKDARAYLKMGDAYYNLSTGGYLKPSRTLPRGPSEVVVNLSGMGDYFLMPPDQVMREREDLVYVGDLVRVTDTKGNAFKNGDIVRCIKWEEGDIPLFEREGGHLRQYLELNQFEILN